MISLQPSSLTPHFGAFGSNSGTDASTFGSITSTPSFTFGAATFKFCAAYRDTVGLAFPEGPLSLGPVMVPSRLGCLYVHFGTFNCHLRAFNITLHPRSRNLNVSFQFRGPKAQIHILHVEILGLLNSHFRSLNLGTPQFLPDPQKRPQAGRHSQRLPGRVISPCGQCHQCQACLP